MKLAAYQFGITGNVNNNMQKIKNAIKDASFKKVDMIVFPECAVSGYPPRDVPDSKKADYDLIGKALSEIKELSDDYNIFVIIGTMICEKDHYNRAYVFSPHRKPQCYDKRALYGWDNENFKRGSRDGVYEIAGMTVGVRICFEARFPEYFRELYKAGTDLDTVIFYAASDGSDDPIKYEVIKSNLITRAVENVTPVFSVNTSGPYQTAPTCFIDASGRVISEASRGEEEMLIVDFDKKELDFGELGRKRESDILLGI